MQAWRNPPNSPPESNETAFEKVGTVQNLASIKGPAEFHADPAFVRGPKTPTAAAAADHNNTQSVYLSASGSPIQFNAIVAAIQGSLIGFNADGALRGAAAGALLLHVLAAFLLCWAARPVAERPNSVRGLAFADDHRHAADTFRNYRRGWRMTLLALLVSAGAAALFVLHAFGISASPVLTLWN